MAVIVGSTWVRFGTGVSRVGSRELVRQTHGERLAQNEHRFRAVTQATPITWAGKFSTTSTSYVTIAAGYWRAPYNIYGAGTSFEFTRIIRAENADVRVTLDAVGGGSPTSTVASLTTAAVDVASIGAGSLAVRDALYRVTIEAKAPAAGTANVWSVALACVDLTGASLY